MSACTFVGKAWLLVGGGRGFTEDGVGMISFFFYLDLDPALLMVSLTRVINKPVFTKSYVLTLALIDRSLSLNDDRIPTCWNVRPI